MLWFTINSSSVCSVGSYFLSPVKFKIIQYLQPCILTYLVKWLIFLNRPSCRLPGVSDDLANDGNLCISLIDGNLYFTNMAYHLQTYIAIHISRTQCTL